MYRSRYARGVTSPPAPASPTQATPTTGHAPQSGTPRSRGRLDRVPTPSSSQSRPWTRAVVATGLAALLLLGSAGCTDSAPDPNAVAVPPPDPNATALPPSTPEAEPQLPPSTPPASSPAPTGSPATEDPATSPEALEDDPEPTTLGTFPVESIPEASGIAASSIDPDRLWLLDDGPGTTSVWAIRTDGTVLGEVTMAGVEGVDTEALAVAPCTTTDPQPCIWVGDIGDNLPAHDAIRVHRFPEPATVDGPATVEVTTAAFTYPDGPVNAESMVIGPDARPWILTREEDVTRLFAPTTFADGPLEQLATMEIPVPRLPLLAMFAGLVVTDAARHPDDGRLLLRTYDSAVVLTPPSPDADPATIADWTVEEVPTAAEPQGEAITWLPASGDRPPGYATVSEGTGTISFVPR